MAVTKQASRALLNESQVNPKTGRAWTLADDEVRTGAAAAKKAVLKTSSTAASFLKAGGFLTPTGKLAKKYGG